MAPVEIGRLVLTHLSEVAVLATESPAIITTPSFVSPDVDPYLDVFEAAMIPNVHPQTIRKAAREGRLRSLKVNGAHVLRFRRSWVLAWLEGR